MAINFFLLWWFVLGEKKSRFAFETDSTNNEDNIDSIIIIKIHINKRQENKIRWIVFSVHALRVGPRSELRTISTGSDDDDGDFK